VRSLPVLGDKNTVGGAQGNAWYDQAVPIADEIWRSIVAAEGLWPITLEFMCS